MLITAGIGAATNGIGSLFSAQKEKRAAAIERANYLNQQNALKAEKYRDPLNSVSNKALLSQMQRTLERNNDALENRAVAGGATFENSLAAKQATNDAIGNTVNALMQGEDSRRSNYNSQLLNLEAQHNNALINQQQLAAQRWAEWGNAMANGITNLGSTYLLQKNTTV